MNALRPSTRWCNRCCAYAVGGSEANECLYCTKLEKLPIPTSQGVAESSFTSRYHCRNNWSRSQKPGANKAGETRVLVLLAEGLTDQCSRLVLSKTRSIATPRASERYRKRSTLQSLFMLLQDSRPTFLHSMPCKKRPKHGGQCKTVDSRYHTGCCFFECKKIKST
jgi:hypothetical protein